MTTSLTPATPSRVWSSEQNDIFTEFETSRDNLVVIAFAGTGKTTTGIEGVRRAPEKSILYCAYNKRIQEELVKKATEVGGCPNVQFKTLHSVGLAIVKRFWEDVRVNFTSERERALAEDVCGGTAPDAIKKLVGQLHTKGREIAPHASKVGDLTNIALNFDLAPDESWTSAGFGLEYVEEKALAAMELAAKVKPFKTGIDGSDMIFLPIRNGWLTKTWDAVVVDEAQDMTVAQLEIAQGVCRGRIIVIGDPNQAIYGFRGADSESISRLKQELNAKELTLSTTYRCGQAIVREAQRYVPTFTAGPNNPEGEVLKLADTKLVASAGPGDFILSRLNAPLVSIAMQLLRAGKRTRVAGRDIGAGLKGLIRKFRATSVPNLLQKISAWEDREVDRMTKANREDRIETIHDQAEMLISLTDGAKNVAEVEGRIEALFTDDGLGDAGMVTCSSVHRSKGLEADRVFVLKDTLRNDKKEELNICYVAVTRAKKTLVYVYKETK